MFVCLSRFFLIFHSRSFYRRGSSLQVENLFVCLFVIMAFAGASLKSTQTFATNFLIFTNPPLSLRRDSSKLKTWWSFEKIRSKIDAKMKYSEWFRFICWRWSAGDNRKWKSPPIFCFSSQKWFTEKAEFVQLGFLEVLSKSFFLYWSGILNGPKSKIFCYCKYIPVLFPTFHRLSCTKRAEKGLFSFPFISTSCILLFVSCYRWQRFSWLFVSKIMQFQNQN